MSKGGRPGGSPDPVAERYRLLFEHNPQPMWLYDPETLKILDVNRAAIAHYGYPRARFLEMTLRDLRPPSGLGALDRDIQEVRSASGPRRSTGHVHLKADGSEIEVEVAADDLVVAGVRARMVVVHDVTAERRAQRALEASEARYRRSFEEDLTADFIATADGRLLDCNPEFVRVFGFASREEALASSMTDLYPPEFPRSEYLRLVADRGRLERFQLSLVRPDGRRVEVIENVAGVFDDQGRLSGIRGYLFDITDHVRLEEQLRESQKLEAVGRLAGGIAHDFNNILAVILSSASFALESLADSHPAAVDLREVVSAAEKAARLTDQLLTFGRRASSRREQVDLNTLVAEAQEIFARVLGEDVQLELRLDGRPLLALVDRSQLEQVLLVLALNAREAMPQGGVLRIETDRRSVADVAKGRALGIEVGRYGVLTVRDTGVGMSAEVLARCFEPFFTTKPDGRGTGLGLAVAFGIARQHGGVMVASSRQGEGAALSLYLPLLDRDEPSGPHRALDVGSVERGTVLVCEDEASVRDAVRRILENEGYLVLAASGPGDALLSLERYRGTIDLLLTDVVMPRMPGPELARHGLALRPELKVLLMSGRVDVDLEVSSGHSLLRKPFDRAALLEAVERALDRS